MAHFAKLDQNNTVLEVHVISNTELLDENGVEQESKGIQFLINWCNGTHTNWKQASYNGNIRKRYPSVGDTYNPQLDIFLPPKPYPSWVLHETMTYWISPIAAPEENSENYDWNEANQAWVLVQ